MRAYSRLTGKKTRNRIRDYPIRFIKMSEIELVKRKIALAEEDIATAKTKLKDAEERKDEKWMEIYENKLTSLNNQFTALQEKENLLLAQQQPPGMVYFYF
jgi:hypothetical protein